MERAKFECMNCIAGIHSEHDLGGCTHVVQRWARGKEEYAEICCCTKTPDPLKIPNVLKLKIKGPS